MPEHPLRIAYFAHSVRSDWNNGNAHFLRGLLRELGKMGHEVTVLEPKHEWSIDNLRTEPNGECSLQQFEETYRELEVQTYSQACEWQSVLERSQIVVVHEWNPPALAQQLLALREQYGFSLLFHDTHHRASSSPEAMRSFGLHKFDGILAFGESLRKIYRTHFGLEAVWTLHEAADISIFQPATGPCQKNTDVVWIGNWGDNERSAEIRAFLLDPAAMLSSEHNFTIYGVRYPQEALAALARCGVQYRGYLPNLEAPAVYAAAKLTVHIPRQQYSAAMRGIPTIRVFEALACGIPLISAPWEDAELLFQHGDYWPVCSGDEAADAMASLLRDEQRAQAQAEQGLSTVLAHHTCAHRARTFTAICNEVLA